MLLGFSEKLNGDVKMACTENHCKVCDHEWFSNIVKEVCPRCKSPEVKDGIRLIQRFYDEYPPEECENLREED